MLHSDVTTVHALPDPAYFMRVGIHFGALTWPREEAISPDTLAAHFEATAVCD